MAGAIAQFRLYDYELDSDEVFTDYAADAALYHCVDLDEDGVTNCDGDCDDNDPDSYPGNPEVCDGADNDCDGQTDEDFTNLGQACTVGVGECEASGVYVCTGDQTGTECDATAGTPSAELCDGLDNDCDTEVDEDFANLGQACTAGVGECEASGVYVCTGDQTGTECGATPGTPSAELCDGLDNDCDGTADEDNPEGGGQCGTTDVGECEFGVYECQSPSLVCVGNVEPVTEICANGLDDDCDGEVDDVDPCGEPDPQTSTQQLCINELNKGLAKVAKTQGKDIGACVKNGSKGKLGAQSIEECLTADNKGKVAKAKQKLLSKAGPKCTEAPGVGANDPNTVNRVAVEKELALIHEIFGSDLDAVILDAREDAEADGAKCQVALAKAAQKCQDAKLKEFSKCKKAGLKDGSIKRAADLQLCMGLDPKQKIQKACVTKLGGTVSKKCPGSVDLAAAVPGCNTGDPGELGACVDRLVECQVCLALNEADRLDRDCDLFDDTLDNDSCP
jgi:hypothetical protein